MGSGTTSRGSGLLRRGMRSIPFLLLAFSGGSRSTLGTLSSVFRTALLAVGDARGVEGTADHVIADTGKILNTAATNQNDRVLLQIVADARDVGCDLNSIGKADAGNLTKSRVRLLGGCCVHAGTNAAALRAGLQCGAGGLVPGGPAAFTHKLIKRRHENSSPKRLQARFPRSDIPSKGTYAAQETARYQKC